MKIVRTIKNQAVLGRSFVEAFLELRKSEPDLLKSLADNAQIALVAFEAKDAAFRASASLLSDTLQPALDKVTALVEQVLTAVVKVLQVKVSTQWSPMWGEAGFVLNSIQIPVPWEARVLLLETLAKFFQKHADWENADYGVTAANLLSLSVSLKAAAQAKKQHEAAHRQLSEQRDAAAARLRTRMGSMIDEVKHVLAPDDVRWKEFNLPTPEEAKSEAFKEARERKKTEKAASRQEQRLDTAIRQLSTARIRGEKARTRYERTLATLQSLKEEVEPSAADIAQAEAKVTALGGSGALVSLSRQVSPIAVPNQTASSALVA